MAVLIAAHSRVQLAGSCTVCLAVMQETPLLKLCLVGDCGARVVRGGEGVVFRTEPQQRQFNQPFQLSSPRLYPRGTVPGEGRQYRVPVQEGDVLVLGSDGLFDNLWDGEVMEVVRGCLEQGPPPRALSPGEAQRAAHAAAAELAQRARARSRDPSCVTPWGVRRQEGVANRVLRALTPTAGGKVDDVTVVVGIIG